MNKNIAFIRSKVSAAELLCQLAEECTELAHAAMKLRRVITGESPTPVSFTEAHNAVLEELADLALCIKVCGYDNADTDEIVTDIGREKLDRWVKRLGGKQNE